MRQFLISAVLMLASALFLAWRGGMAYDFFDEWPLVLGAVIYGLAAVWWIVLAAGAKQRLLLNFLLVWVPAFAPVAPFVHATRAAEQDDAETLAVLLHFGPAAVAVLACTAGAFVIFQRALWPKEGA